MWDSWPQASRIRSFQILFSKLPFKSLSVYVLVTEKSLEHSDETKIHMFSSAVYLNHPFKCKSGLVFLFDLKSKHIFLSNWEKKLEIILLD